MVGAGGTPVFKTQPYGSGEQTEQNARQRANSVNYNISQLPAPAGYKQLVKLVRARIQHRTGPADTESPPAPYAIRTKHNRHQNTEGRILRRVGQLAHGMVDPLREFELLLRCPHRKIGDKNFPNQPAD